MGTMQPLGQLRRRVRTQGRIRLGEKNAKGNPTKLSTFRFTCPDKEAIEAIAGRYGGEVRPWSDPKAAPKEQWQVKTPAKAIDIWLPPGALTVDYEKWGGKGRERVCDGIRVDLEVEKGRGQWETVPQDCICNARGRAECVPVTRLSVILPVVTFGGVWRLESKGWNAAEELPAIVEAIDELQADGILQARLVLDERTSRGGSRQYVVPSIELVSTPQQMLEGGAQVQGALGAGPAPLAIEAPWDGDDEVAEAEVVEEPDAALLELAGRALEADDEAPMVPPQLVCEGMLAQWPYNEVERKLAGVADRKARMRLADSGEWEVVRR